MYNPPQKIKILKDITLWFDGEECLGWLAEPPFTGEENGRVPAGTEMVRTRTYVGEKAGNYGYSNLELGLIDFDFSAEELENGEIIEKL